MERIEAHAALNRVILRHGGTLCSEKERSAMTKVILGSTDEMVGCKDAQPVKPEGQTERKTHRRLDANQAISEGV
jgi:hypothetical protein